MPKGVKVKRYYIRKWELLKMVIFLVLLSSLGNSCSILTIM